MQLGIIQTQRRRPKTSKIILHSVSNVLSAPGFLFKERADAVADKNKIDVKSS